MNRTDRDYLCLINGGYGRPPREELRRLEEQDLAPRAIGFEGAIGADTIDEEFFTSTQTLTANILSSLPLLSRTVLTAYLIRHQYRAIISWSERIGLPLAALLKVARSRIPHVGLFSWISRSPKNHILSLVHSHIDRIVLWNRYQYDYAINRLQIPGSKLVLLRWFVDGQFFRPVPNSEVKGICAVGSEMRDYGTLVKAMRDFPAQCHVAAGTAKPEPDWSFESLPPNVTVGRKNYLELRELYARSRFVVLPIDSGSDTDNGITATLEAFAMGLPVIISRTVAQMDVVRDGENGLFVAPGDPRALREAMLTLWNDPERCRRMGEAARECALRNHRMEDFAAGVLRAAEEAESLRKIKGVR